MSTGKPARRSQIAPQLILAALPFAAAVAATLAAVVIFVRDSHDATRETDFQVFYSAGRLAADRRFADLHRPDPILAEERKLDPDRDRPTPFVYPATLALLLAPLAILPYDAAYSVLLFVNAVAFAALCVLVWATSHPAEPKHRCLVIFFFSVAFGTVGTLLHGQFDIILTLFLFASMHAALQGRGQISFLATLPLALKLQFLPGICFYWLYRRKWFHLTGVIAGTLALFLWPVVFQPEILPNLIELYTKFFTGGEPYESNFQARFGLVQVLVAPFVAMAAAWAAWRFWDRHPSEKERWMLVFLLPAVLTVYGPREVILAGVWAILLSNRDISTERLAFWGMLLVAFSTFREVIPEVNLVVPLAVFLYITGAWPFGRDSGVAAEATAAAR